jgi:hypothetical protein
LDHHGNGEALGTTFPLEALLRSHVLPTLAVFPVENPQSFGLGDNNAMGVASSLEVSLRERLSVEDD